MRVALAYFILECKKSAKVFGKSIISMMLMLAILIAGVAVVSYTLLQAPAFQKVRVAVVIPEEETLIEVGTRYISGMESVESICEFDYMDHDTALDELAQGNVQAMIEFPVNFFDDVYHGKDTPVTIMFPKEGNRSTEVFKGLLTAGISILQTSEAGVYAMMDVADDYPVRLTDAYVGDYMATIYAKEALGRGKVFEQFVLSPTGRINHVQYYFVSLVILILLMSGLNYGHLYRANRRSVEQRLRIYGVGPLKMTMIKIAIMAGSSWVVGMLLYIGGCIITSRTEMELVSFDAGAVGGLLLLCLSIAAYFHAMYAIAGGSKQGTVLLLCANFIMILCSGLLVPMAYLPEVVQQVGAWTPVTFWNRYYTGLVFDKIYMKEIVQVFVLFFLGSGIGVTVLWKDA